MGYFFSVLWKDYIEHMLAPVNIIFKNDVLKNINNYNICQNGFGATLCSIPPTVGYEENLVNFSFF